MACETFGYFTSSLTVLFIIMTIIYTYCIFILSILMYRPNKTESNNSPYYIFSTIIIIITMVIVGLPKLCEYNEITAWIIYVVLIIIIISPVLAVVFKPWH